MKKQINGSLELTALGSTKAKINEKPVLLILLDQHGIEYLKEKKTVTLKFTGFAFNPTKPDDYRTHILKPILEKSIYEALTHEHRQNIPIIGDLREFQKIDNEPANKNAIIIGEIVLTRLKHAIREIKGAMYLVLWIEENNLIIGEKNGGIYLNWVAWLVKDHASTKSTYIIKQSFSKEVAESMTDEQKKLLPVIGNLNVKNPSNNNPDETLATAAIKI